MASRDFGTLLRRYRVAAAMSQEALAERARLSARAISDLERGIHRAPRLDTVELLADALRLSSADREALESAVNRRRGPRAAESAEPPHYEVVPAPPDPLLGRDAEVAAATALLRDGTARLLTCTGPAGVGKTSLALRVAVDLRDDFTDGVCFVSLAAVREPALVRATIAHALGVREEGREPLMRGLTEVLGDRRLLLILDNFEHLLEAATDVRALVVACPRLSVLVTSRAALRVRGEQEFPVPPLALPKSDSAAPDDIERTAAGRLLVMRARAAQPDFAVTAAAAPALAAICRRLDGLPLALELAAPRLKLLPPQALLARLERRLHLLTGGARDLPERQQTLRRTIAWSFDLLDRQEQRLFQRLAVFAGGWTLEAAEVVGSAEDASGANVLAGLEALVEHSLVSSVPGYEEPRFVMLETIHEFAMERLEASGEVAELRDRHAAWCMELAEPAAAALTGPDQAHWLARLETEHDNLRSALSWAKEAEDLAAGLRLAVLLWRFWHIRGYVGEGRGWLEELLARSARDDVAVDPALRARALVGAGVLAYAQDDHARAAALHEESLALRRDLGDTAGVAASLTNLGNVAIDRGDYAHAFALHQESLALRRELGDRPGIAASLSNLGLVARCLGDIARAEALHTESLGLRRSLGDQWGIAVSLSALATVAIDQGDYPRAIALHDESLGLRRHLGDRQGIAACLSGLGVVAVQQGDHTRAAASLRESLTLYEQCGSRLGVTRCLEELGGVAHMTGRPREAARLFGAAARLRGEIGTVPTPADQARSDRARAATRAALGEDAFEEAWSLGAGLSRQQAMREALHHVT